MKHRHTAGGIVLDPFGSAGRVLLIERDVKRNGKMIHEIRLPKGKIEPGETDERAAQREVAEETGYPGTKIIDDLGRSQTPYIRQKKGKRTELMRHEHYYLMGLTDRTYAGMDVDPDSEEALFEVRWAKDMTHALKRLTYDSEREFIRRAMAWFDNIMD